jgi:hypothetical protein
MKKIAFLLFLVLTGSSAFAQTGLASLFSKAFETVNEKSGKERFKGQILKGKRNGMGATFTKQGFVFIGDFYRDEMTGMGMMIAADGSSIANCEGCAVYVGNWKDGRKSGFGKCYDIEGNMIYKGQFAEDKPTGSYSTAVLADESRHLSKLQLGINRIYLGETTDNKPNGLGVVIYPNGALWFHAFKEGNASGIGLYMAHDGEWQTLKWENGTTVTVSSSEYYKKIDQARKASFTNDLLGVLLEFGGEMIKETTDSKVGTFVGNALISASGNGNSGKGSSSSTSSSSSAGNNAEPQK